MHQKVAQILGVARAWIRKRNIRLYLCSHTLLHDLAYVHFWSSPSTCHLVLAVVLELFEFGMQLLNFMLRGVLVSSSGDNRGLGDLDIFWLPSDGKRLGLYILLARSGLRACTWVCFLSRDGEVCVWRVLRENCLVRLGSTLG